MSSSFPSPWTVALQGLLPLGFSRQKYSSGLPFPSAGDLPNPGMELTSLMSPAFAGGFFTAEPPEKPIRWIHKYYENLNQKYKYYENFNKKYSEVLLIVYFQFYYSLRIWKNAEHQEWTQSILSSTNQFDVAATHGYWSNWK